MAVVQNIREKVHLPIYDSVHVEPGQQLRQVERSSTLKFFVNVNNKTKLETNLQSASLLPHYNTFEARAMRVVISDLPASFSADVQVLVGGRRLTTGLPLVTLKTNLRRAKELLELALLDDNRVLRVRTVAENGSPSVVIEDPSADENVALESHEIERGMRAVQNGQAPPPEQIRPNNGSGNVVSKLIFSTVTSLFVGEKLMIEMPTWFFPGGAGAYSESASVITHGEPSPTATFRFAEPIYIDKQQNFRVELEIPDSEVLKEIQQFYGPLFIWVVLDGYMTRDVQ